jgi:hypothetical protein
MMRIFLFIILTTLTVVTPFAPSAYRCTGIYTTTTLHGAARGGGAMARRKKQIVRIEDEQQDDNYDEIITHDNKRGIIASANKSISIYSMPPLYDLAFGYRNYEEEVDFLLRMHSKHSSSMNNNSGGSGGIRVLELAAGPARHSLSALSCHSKTIFHSVLALDSSIDMVEYGLKNANFDLGNSGGGGRRDDFVYVCGDMRQVCNYCPTTTATIQSNDDSTSFDGVWLLLGSMQHLLTNDDVISLFSSLHSVMKDGATIVIELPHPREIFKMGECTTNGWTVPLVEEGDHDDVDYINDDKDNDDEDDEDDGKKQEGEYGQLNIVWGKDTDEFDPVSQIRHFTIEFELTVNDINNIPPQNNDDDDTSILFSQMKKTSNGGSKLNVKEAVPLRLFTLQEIDALARCAGFEMVDMYGALSEDVSIDDEDEAFRMVCVLRKKQR